MDSHRNSESKEIKKRFNKIPTPSHIDKTEIIPQFMKYKESIEVIMKNWDDYGFQLDESPEDIIGDLVEDIPKDGTELDELHNFVVEKLISRFTFENNKFLAFVPRDPAPPAVIGDALTPFFNQFLGSALASPVGTIIESLTIKWIGKLLGYEGDFFGSYTIGGSDANLSGIYTGLVNTVPWNYKEKGSNGGKQIVIYTSDQAHMCIKKAMMFLGLGTDHLRIIETDDDFRMTPSKVKDMIIEDLNNNLLPSMIIASAGSTNTGSIDDLKGLAELANDFGLWFHVDAAYGGFAKIAEHPVSKELDGIELADSIAIDTHKWFYTPMEGGLILAKRAVELKKGFDLSAEYLVDSNLKQEHEYFRNFSSFGIPLTRKWRGLMVWFNFKTYGISGLKNLITKNILVADYFRSRIKEHNNLRLIDNTNLGMVCFRWKGSDDLNLNILENVFDRGKFMIGRTNLKDQLTLRACILNQRSSPEIIDELIIEMENIVREIEL